MLKVMCVLIAVVIFYLIRAEEKRKTDYFEPILCVLGAGPRRDLTAVEAAVVLERPLDKVATMILFGLVRKNRVAITSEVPLRLKVLSKILRLAKCLRCHLAVMDLNSIATWGWDPSIPSPGGMKRVKLMYRIFPHMKNTENYR